MCIFQKYICEYTGYSRKLKKARQARLGLNHLGFRKKIEGFEFFLKFRISLVSALSSDTSLELAALILNSVPPFNAIIF